MGETERPPRPEVSIFEGDEGEWEVLIESHEDFEVNVKVGNDPHRDGLPLASVNVQSDDGIVQRGGSGGDYAYFHRLPANDDA